VSWALVACTTDVIGRWFRRFALAALIVSIRREAPVLRRAYPSQPPNRRNNAPRTTVEHVPRYGSPSTSIQSTPDAPSI
jgi:hypothetical protein